MKNRVFNIRLNQQRRNPEIKGIQSRSEFDCIDKTILEAEFFQIEIISQQF